jgi:subtilisin family serine protease
MRSVQSGLALLGLALALQAGELSPGLQRLMADTPDGQEIGVLVLLENQAPIPALDRELHESGATLAHRHFQVVESLQQAARNSQAPVADGLQKLQAQGRIREVKPYWLINGFGVATTTAEVAALADLPGVSRVEPFPVVELIQPIRPETQGDGQREIGITEALRSMDVDRVWYELDVWGEGAIVGNLDTGVNPNHESLASRYRGLTAPAGQCWMDALGSSTTPSDGNGHGTHVMGTITGLASNDSIGVAPAATWIACNAINQGVGGSLDSDVIEALEWFADPDGNPNTHDEVPDVIQNSWGVAEWFGGYFDCDDRWWQAIDNCEAAGVVLTWSAGNEGSGAQSMRSPADRATTPLNCFSVGSTIQMAPLTISDFSSRGPSGCDTDWPIKPEVVAPGSDIYSADAFSNTGYMLLSGTSMAGPHVAGVVGLMRSANPDLDVETIKQILIDTAVDLGPVGEDNSYGHGFVNAYEAVLAAMTNFVSVSGVVRDSQSLAPLAGVRVRSLNAGPGLLTGVDGSYAMNLPAGPHSLQASLWGYTTQTFELELVQDSPVVQDVNLAMVASATLAGVVRNSQGLGVDGALVSVLDTPASPVLTAPDGSFSFLLPLGETYTLRSQSTSGTVSLPLGPDEYGYRAFDLADGDWLEQSVTLAAGGSQVELRGRNRAGDFSHTLIDPEQGGAGTALDFVGEDDLTLHAGLPFTFRYYGQDFDSLSISANGWVALGITNSGDFSGFNIPDPADGPMAMLAMYWEDLSPQAASSGNVSTYHDAANGRFVVEYNNIRQFSPQSAFETFAVHLLDPAVYPTETGDGAILFWYGQVSNLNDTAVGIESPDGTQGLQIWNGRHDGSGTPGGLLSPNCMTVAAGSQFLFTTGLTGVTDLPLVPVDDLSIQIFGGQVNLQWSPSSGAQTYRVERAIGSGLWLPLGITAGTAWNEPAVLGVRQYRVIAID